MAGTSCLSQYSQSDDHHTGRKADHNRDQVHHTKRARNFRKRAIRAYARGSCPLQEQLNDREMPAGSPTHSARPPCSAEAMRDDK